MTTFTIINALYLQKRNNPVLTVIINPIVPSSKALCLSSPVDLDMAPWEEVVNENEPVTTIRRHRDCHTRRRVHTTHSLLSFIVSAFKFDPPIIGFNSTKARPFILNETFPNLILWRIKDTSPFFRPYSCSYPYRNLTLCILIPNSYVMKLFDRSVDQAQVNNSTSLYPK